MRLANKGCDTEGELEIAVEEVTSWGIDQNRPLIITGYRNLGNQTVGLQYGYMKPSYHLINVLLVNFDMDIFGLSTTINQRLLNIGCMVDHEYCTGATHRFLIGFGGYGPRWYFGKFSRHDAIIEGFRLGAIEIRRV